MTPEDAEAMFFEFGKVLEHQWLGEPEKYGPRLQQATRADLRRAILLWAAIQKYRGHDLRLRGDLLPGQPIAVLELVDNLWPLTQLFGEVRDGRPVSEPRGEQSAAARMLDGFVDFLLNLNPDDPDYWQKVEAQLNRARSAPGAETRWQA